MANPGIKPRVNAWGIPVTRHHPLRGLYDQIIGRCHLRNYYAYDRYGGRGIRVCERWREPHGQGFWNFVFDMGERPTAQHTVDRIDNDGGYEPNNCKWSTRREQASNRRNSRDIVGVSQFQTGWRAELYSNGKHYRKLFKNKGDAIEQRRAWEDGEFEDNLIRKRG